MEVKSKFNNGTFNLGKDDVTHALKEAMPYIIHGNVFFVPESTEGIYHTQ